LPNHTVQRSCNRLPADWINLQPPANGLPAKARVLHHPAVGHAQIGGPDITCAWRRQQREVYVSLPFKELQGGMQLLAGLGACTMPGIRNFSDTWDSAHNTPARCCKTDDRNKGPVRGEIAELVEYRR